MDIKIEKYSCAKILFLIVCLWFLMLLANGSLWAGYHLTDQHTIFTNYYDSSNHENTNVINHLINQWRSRVLSDLSLGRFRPVWSLHFLIETKFFGINLLGWSLYTGFLAVLTTLCFFVFGILIEFSIIESLLFSLIITIGRQTAIWWQLIPSEIIGTFLLSVTLIFMALSIRASKHNDIYEFLFLICGGLMSLAKESFIICIPALMFGKLWLFYNLKSSSWLEALKRSILSLSGLSIIFISELLVIKYGIGFNGTGYAGFEGVKIVGMLRVIKGYGVIGIPLLITVLVYGKILTKSSPFSLQALKNLPHNPISLFTVILLPQILLYAKSGLYDRYILPGIFGYSFLLLWLYRGIDRKYVIVRKIILWSTIAAIAFNYVMAWHDCHKYAKDRKSVTELVNVTKTNTTSNSPILIVSNPWVYFEWTSAIKTYLNYEANRKNLYLTTYGYSQTDFTSTSIRKKYESFWYFLNIKPVKDKFKKLIEIDRKQEIQCIIVFPQLNEDFQKTSSDWFQAKNYKAYKFNFINDKFYLYCHN